MSRYLYNNKKKITNVHENNAHYNKTGFDTTIYPRIIRKPSDTVIITKSTDRLDLLAHRFYSNRTYWWVIALANNLSGDSFYIIPGTQIFIPKDINSILNGLRIKNSVGE
jgi:nucleoid-associated protein YgaU